MIEGVIIDAGHGGIDSGAVGNGLLEKDLNLKISQYIYNRLKELGIPAKMTREEDIYLPKNERVQKVLGLYNNSPNTILIANHINAGGAEGAEVVYSLKNNSTLADIVLKNLGEAGQIKRKTYQRRLPENPNKDYYYILRETGNTEPILIEYGFIDNAKDVNKLKNDLDKYGEAVVKSIAEYIDYPYKEPNNNEEIIPAEEHYIIKKGDTLYSISRKFNIPINTLKQINNLQDNNLSIGQKIYLTDFNKNNNSKTYIVQRGDTLYAIAKKYNIPLERLKVINGLTDNILQIGQMLIIENEKDENIDQEEIIDEEFTIYEVNKGDSLWKIATAYNISVPQLIEKNNLTDLTLQIGQKLLVPKTEEETYTVQKGDTLCSIAKKYEITVDQLKERNNLTQNLLSVGQVLKIK